MIIWSTLWRKYDANGNMSVPSNLANHVKDIAPTLSNYGIDAVLWPPLTMAQGGTADNADGYGKARDLDVGQWSPTRWGTATQVQDANRELHNHGILAFEDAVIHQYAGSLPIYEFDKNGKIDRSRFPKMPTCFVPQVKVDNVFDPDGNQAFGQMVSYQNSKPAGYMLHGTIQSMQWRKSRLGLDGGRLDDTKGEASSISQRIIERVGGWWVGECFTGNPSELQRWVNETGGKRTLDFTLHWAIKAACEGTNTLRALPGNGFYDRDPDHSVLFVESADTDNNNNENVRFNKIWGYLLICTLPAAAAMIYAGDAEKYGLQKQILNLCWISTVFAYGNLRWEHVEDDVIVWSRDGNGGKIGQSNGLLCGFSRSFKYGGWVRTPFKPNTLIHDYTGNAFDLRTNQDGWVYLSIPQGKYVAYGVAGVEKTITKTPLKDTISGNLFDFSEVDVIYA